VNPRRALLHALRPMSRLLDKVNLRIGRPTLHGDLYHFALGQILPGDIVLTRTAWRPTNWIFPGKWTHALISLGGDELVEATLPRVRRTWMVDVWCSASEVIIVRPRFLSDQQGVRAALAAESFIGVPYDLDFAPTPKALYCSELIMRAMIAANIDTPELRTKVLGEWSIKPDAFTDPDLFKRIASSGVP
jgi:hypothetical protein